MFEMPLEELIVLLMDIVNGSMDELLTKLELEMKLEEMSELEDEMVEQTTGGWYISSTS
jgi:hypothetical protein